jgi:hypothetical protein
MDIEKIIKNNRNTIYLTLTIIFVLFVGWGFVIEMPKDMRAGIYPEINKTKMDLEKLREIIYMSNNHKHNIHTGRIYFPNQETEILNKYFYEEYK